MKYLILLLLVLGCEKKENKVINLVDDDDLKDTLRSLQFSTFSLNCTANLNPKELRKKADALKLPVNRDVAYLMMDSAILNCLQKKYNELSK